MASTTVTTGAPPTDVGGSSARVPKEFFSLQSIGTLAGASSGLFVIVGALSQATSWSYPPWFPLVVAFALVTLIDLAVTQGWRGGTLRELPARILVLTLNGCLVFTSALGGAVAFRGYNEPGTTTTVANPTAPASAPVAPAEPAHAAGPSHAAGESTAAQPSHPTKPRVTAEPSRPAETALPRAVTRFQPNRRPSGFGRMLDAFRE
jgi:hypothetical protein